jgi:hypothetical protein
MKKDEKIQKFNFLYFFIFFSAFCEKIVLFYVMVEPATAWFQ